MPRLGIFGSCVTRDLFEDPEIRPALAQYTSRTSLASVVADPVAIDPELVRLDSQFQRRCVLEDFDKSFFDRLAADTPDFLIVDLIDERFDLLRTGDSWVTRSSAFVSAGLDDAPGFEFDRVRRLTDEAEHLTDAAAARFAERLHAILPPERVIVHRAWWLTRYRTADGAVESFPDERATFADRQNRALEHFYDELERCLGNRAPTIALGRDSYLADAGHKWDLEPFHYEPAYNEAALARLREITGA